MTGAKDRKLDAADRRILAILQRDGRITNQKLSDQVGLSPRACLDRVRRLEAAGLIAGYRAVLDPRRAANLTIFFAEITMRDHSQGAMAAFERRLRACPDVVECYMVGGQFDYVARIACPGIDHYRELTAGWIDDPVLGVARIVTSIVMNTVQPFTGYPLDSDDDAG